MALTSYLFYGAIGVASGAVVLANISPWFIPKAKPATLDYLAKAKLQTIGNQPKNFSAQELWQQYGAVVMAVRRPG